MYVLRSCGRPELFQFPVSDLDDGVSFLDAKCFIGSVLDEDSGYFS